MSGTRYPQGDPDASPDLPPVQQPATQGPYVPVSPKGTVAWAIGFLAYLPIPFFGNVISAVVQLLVGLAQRKHGILAAANGTRAANWALSQLIVLAVLFALAVGSIVLEDGGDVAQQWSAVSIMAMGLGYVAFGVALLVYAIVGTVQASGGRLVSLPVLPLLRTRPEWAWTAKASGPPPTGGPTPPADRSHLPANGPLPPRGGSSV